MASSVVATDLIDEDRATALSALLDAEQAPANGDLLPLMWQLIYFLPRPAQSDLGPDGHPLHGYPTPPGPGLRRMFAGGRTTMRPGLRVGHQAEAQTTVVSTKEKAGRAGTLTFVTTQTNIVVDGIVVLTDERDIVYLPGGPTPGLTTRSPTQADVASSEPRPQFLKTVRVDPTLLFRFSALTYNSHRIHYDRPYATEAEGYPSLVVHGPLQALLMAETGRQLMRTDAALSIEYRLMAPLYEGEGLHVTGAPDGEAAKLQVRDDRGRVTARSTVSVVR